MSRRFVVSSGRFSRINSQKWAHQRKTPLPASCAYQNVQQTGLLTQGGQKPSWIDQLTSCSTDQKIIGIRGNRSIVKRDEKNERKRMYPEYQGTMSKNAGFICFCFSFSYSLTDIGWARAHLLIIQHQQSSKQSIVQQLWKFVIEWNIILISWTKYYNSSLEGMEYN